MNDKLNTSENSDGLQIHHWHISPHLPKSCRRCPLSVFL